MPWTSRNVSPREGLQPPARRARSSTTLVAKATPAATFQVDLPATPDFKLHRTFVTPPALSRGFYVIVASPRADFSTGQNPLRAAGMLVTDLVLDIRQTDDGGIEARAVSGTTGQPAAGASVALWRYDWQAGHARAATARDLGGRARRVRPGPRPEREIALPRRAARRRPRARSDLPRLLEPARALGDLLGARLHGPQHLPAASEGALEGGRLQRPGRSRAVARHARRRR